MAVVHIAVRAVERRGRWLTWLVSPMEEEFDEDIMSTWAEHENGWYVVKKLGDDEETVKGIYRDHQDRVIDLRLVVEPR